jgi:hypothetical protein
VTSSKYCTGIWLEGLTKPLSGISEIKNLLYKIAFSPLNANIVWTVQRVRKNARSHVFRTIARAWYSSYYCIRQSNSEAKSLSASQKKKKKLSPYKAIEVSLLSLTEPYRQLPSRGNIRLIVSTYIISSFNVYKCEKVVPLDNNLFTLTISMV